MIVGCPTAHLHDQDPELACLELAERAEGTEDEIAIVEEATQ